MKNIKAVSRILTGVALVLLALSVKVNKVNAATLEIHVSINATKSLSALTTYYDFGQLQLNVSSNSATPLAIRNDSGAYVETYTLQGGNAVSDTSGVNWILAASTSPNHYALGAQFSSARPANTDAAWDATDYLTAGVQGCTTSQFGDGTAGDEGTGILPTSGANDRDLYFRLHTPDVSTGPESRTAQVTIAVQ